MYSRRNILALARRLNVHPGIVVGQLQYRGEILYSHSRDLLVKVRDSIDQDGADRRLVQKQEECMMNANAA